MRIMRYFFIIELQEIELRSVNLDSLKANNIVSHLHQL